MKKSNILAQQVIKAQKAIEDWPESLKSGLRLESSDSFIKSTSETSRPQRTITKERTSS